MPAHAILGKDTIKIWIMAYLLVAKRGFVTKFELTQWGWIVNRGWGMGVVWYMATVKFQGAPVKTVGELPSAGAVAPNFSLAAQDLSDFDLESLKGKRVVLNIFPSIDTDVCAASVRKFNVEVSNLPETVVVCVSADLPFAAQRFCSANGIKNVVTGSTFRSDFGEQYGVEFAEGPLRGLMARSVVVIDKDGKVLGSKMVEEQTNEPDYQYVESLLA